MPDRALDVRFVPLPEPTTEQIERVVDRARASILRWLRRNGYLDDVGGVGDRRSRAARRRRFIAMIAAMRDGS